MLPILANIGKTLKTTGGKSALFIQKHAPELMIGGGLLGFGATIVETVRATNKTNDILDDKAYKESQMEREFLYTDNDNEYTKDLYEADMKSLKRRTRWQIFKAWAPVVTLGGASTVSILGGYRVLNGRYVATAAAYKVLEAGFDRYRGNVIDRFGKDVDWELKNNLKVEEIQKRREETEAHQREEDKLVKRPKKRKKTSWEKCGSILIFDEYSECWRRWWTPQMVLEYLRMKENQANDMLKLRGHVFVNEIMDMLGLQRTSEGAVLGWVWDKNDPGCEEIRFGLDDIPESKLREILSVDRNEEIRVPLNLNPHGVIFDLIDNRNL